MKKQIISTIFVCLLMGGQNALQAQDTQVMQEQLEEQNRKIEQLTRRLEKYEAGQNSYNQQIARHISELGSQVPPEAPAAEFSLPDNLRWLEKLNISGDLRFRNEQIDEQSGGDWKTGRNRTRIRARLQLTADINEDVRLGFRLASGGENPVSTNQNLTDGFTTKDIRLDLAYFDWHPQSFEGFKIIGGKMKNPFHNVGKNQLIWDSDLNPEGLAAQYTKAFNDRQALFINGGGFMVKEEKSDADPTLWGIQAGLNQDFDNDVKLTAGASYYDYGNIQGSTTINFEGKTSGNSFDAADKYLNDYDILEIFAETGFNINDRPVTVYGNYVINTDVVNSEDTGWMAGFKYNKASNPGTWEFGYNYRDLEADAVLGTFCDSDFIGGGANGSGHFFKLKYALYKNVFAGLGYFHNEKGDDDSDYRRLMADIEIKF